ncbi:DegT/DnrJ/EryC1/StrS family aminotransferase [Endozoicomonadaceae bacterium StTr2]
MNTFLPFSTPDISDNEINEVVDTLKSGWLTTGPKAKKFESSFSAFLGGNISSLAVNSATSGLHLALEALGIGVGDEVIVPSYTFTATAEVVRYLGATPVLVDVDPESYNISVTDIEKNITDRTKAIIPVHFAGLACDMDSIISLARKNSFAVIEDAAHALPSTYNGKYIGTLETDATVFSFYANKTMTTAEGGMLVSSRKDIIDRAKIMRLHGISKDVFDRYASKNPSWHYDVVAPGYKYNMPDISAALGLQQLKRLPEFLKKRQQIAEFYFKNLRHLPITLPPLPHNPSDTHAWHLFPILVNKEISRNEFINELFKLGIGCSVHFIPLHKHTIWKDVCSYKDSNLKNSNFIFENEVSIPLYTKMSLNDAQRVVDGITSIMRNKITGI